MTTLRPPPIATFATHDLSQAPHLMRHLLCFGAAKAEDEALADIRARVSGRKRPQPKTFLPGAGRDLLVGQIWRKRDYQVHAGFRTQDLYLRAELFSECLREGIAALRVQLPGPPDVPREMTSAYEISKRRLIQV